ncbi:YbaK/EbsC family protein [Polaromonas sp.]|uniref:YbaK/EbsC family protein n=1 Tax=Polaromonas sp. TaxID=1869339 RepID=UPI0017AC64BE|nr:YbaK/EbsC family protein [Polaromonas sp.]NMM04690.1 DUF1289 domain-containing protein [Polaromonas sp.]
MSRVQIEELPESVQRVADVLKAKGHAHAPVMLDDAARTAQQAADALGVELGQIAKSVVFRRESDDAAVLVIMSGDQRVDEKKVEALVCQSGQRIGRADARFVKGKTGFSIGGVSPLAHASAVVTLIDLSLQRFDEVWAAAGHPHAVFRLTAQQLEQLTGAPVVNVAQDIVEPPERHDDAIKLIAARARTVKASGDIVPSPCISVCRISADTGWCEGCFRTLGEISAWSRSGPDAQRRLWQTIEQRMAG